MLVWRWFKDELKCTLVDKGLLRIYGLVACILAMNISRYRQVLNHGLEGGV
jgi:hypothetical protein